MPYIPPSTQVIASPQASDQGLVAWAYDPVMSTGTITLATGVLQVVKIMLPIPQLYTITNIIVDVQTAGSSLTSGQNLVGLYDSSGALLSGSADQTTSWGGTGTKTIALTSAQAVIGGSGRWVWVGILSNGATPATFRRQGTAATMINAGLTAANGFRFGAYSSGLTSLPTITVASVTASGGSIWVGLS